jgi:hypothetical protein
MRHISEHLREIALGLEFQNQISTALSPDSGAHKVKKLSQTGAALKTLKTAKND